MQDFQILLDARKSTAMSPFGVDKGNDNPDEEMEEVNLDFISEKSSEESSVALGPNRRNSADCSDSEECKVDDDENQRRKSIRETQSRLDLKAGENVPGPDAQYVTEEDKASQEDNPASGMSNSKPENTHSSEKLNSAGSANKAKRKRPSQILKNYETEKKPQIRGQMPPNGTNPSNGESSSFPSPPV